jgi:hypothetical protein
MLHRRKQKIFAVERLADPVLVRSNQSFSHWRNCESTAALSNTENLPIFLRMIEPSTVEICDLIPHDTFKPLDFQSLRTKSVFPVVTRSELQRHHFESWQFR